VSSVTCNAAGLPPLARCHEGAGGEPQPLINEGAGDGQMSANTWALTLILHRTQRVADEAINRALDSSLTSHRGAPWSTPHVTCVTRHAQNAKPTSRCRTVAPWSTPLHHGTPRCDGCATLRTTMKASPHRHNWLLSRGSPADPSDPWNSHAAPVSPRQNGSGEPDAARGR